MFLHDDDANALTMAARAIACSLTVMALAGCVSTDKDAITNLLAVKPSETAAPAAPDDVAANEADDEYTDPMVVAMGGQPTASDNVSSQVAAYSAATEPDPNVVMQPARIQAGRSSIFSVAAADPAASAAPVATTAADGSIVPADQPSRGISPTSTSLFSASAPVNGQESLDVAALPANEGHIRSMPGLAPTTPRLKMRATLSAEQFAALKANTAAEQQSAGGQAQTVAPRPEAVALASEPAPQERKRFALPKWLSRSKK
ncbi:MAG: hypothetical protein ACOH2J_08135 [Allorhizobium sp.]